MATLLDSVPLNELAAALDRYAHEELCRLEGLHELPEDRTHLLDRGRLRHVFETHGFTPERFDLDVEQPDEMLIPALRIVQADVSILAELNGATQ